MKILVTNSWVTPHVEEIRGDFPTVEFVIPGSDEDKTAAAADAEVAFGSVTAELLTAAPALKWVHAASAGVEWMPPELAATDIVVTNTRGAHASTIAEHGFGMLVYLARRFEDLRQAQRDKIWLRPPPQPTVALAGMTMGVIGLGNIGRAIAVRAHAFEMRVIAVDAHAVAQPEYVAELGLLDGPPGRPVAARRHVVAVAVPITRCHARPAEPGQRLALLKPGAYLLALSRGGIVDEPALARIAAGRLPGGRRPGRDRGRAAARRQRVVGHAQHPDQPALVAGIGAHR